MRRIPSTPGAAGTGQGTRLWPLTQKTPAARQSGTFTAILVFLVTIHEGAKQHGQRVLCFDAARQRELAAPADARCPDKV
jgi:hypothetical protein